MKKLFVLILAIFVVGCGSDNDGGGSNEWVELTVQDSDVISSSRVKGEITTVAEVDKYYVELNEINQEVQIKCTSSTLRPDVDLLVNVFEKNASGELTMVAGDHADEDGLGEVSLKIDVNVDEPKTLYITVRDLMDDDSSTNNPYYISASYKAAEDGNGSFTEAEDITIDGDGVSESIGSEDDVDVFGFTVAQAGVFDILVDMDRLEGSDVRLQIQIYNADGDVIETRDQGILTTSHLVHYLTAGEYYVAVSEDGKDAFDNLSVYTVSVSELTGVTEMGENDTMESADNLSQTFDISGSIDYSTDADYYLIDSNVTGDVKIMNLTFQSNASFDFLIELYDADDADEPAFSHTYTGGDTGDGEYVSMLKIGSDATYYLKVSPATKTSVAGLNSYSFSGNVEGIDDADEAGDGNDVEANALTKAADTDHTGKICFNGDNDWYELVMPYSATTKQVLALNLTVPDSDLVRYGMKVTGPGITTEKIVFHSHSEMRGVDLKTGILVPTGDAGTDATYMVKIYDYQDDDADKDAVYTFRWSVTDDITTTPDPCPKDGGTTVYHKENDEAPLEGEEGDYVSIFYPSYVWATLDVDTDVLSFDIGDATSTGTNTWEIQFPWISGYIDYDGDEDVFGLDLSEPLNEGDTSWYYEITLEFYEQSPTVEYMLEYIPDSNGNGKISALEEDLCNENSASSCESGAIASIIEVEPADTVDYAPDDPSGIWAGSGDPADTKWVGLSYVRISDFNYLKINESTYNTEPDNDWGKDAPYYFRFKLTYHNDAAAPDYAATAD